MSEKKYQVRVRRSGKWSYWMPVNDNLFLDSTGAISWTTEFQGSTLDGFEIREVPEFKPGYFRRKALSVTGDVTWHLEDPGIHFTRVDVTDAEQAS